MCFCFWQIFNSAAFLSTLINAKANAKRVKRSLFIIYPHKMSLNYFIISEQNSTNQSSMENQLNVAARVFSQSEKCSSCSCWCDAMHSSDRVAAWANIPRSHAPFTHSSDKLQWKTVSLWSFKLHYGHQNVGNKKDRHIRMSQVGNEACTKLNKSVVVCIDWFDLIHGF